MILFCTQYKIMFLMVNINPINIPYVNLRVIKHLCTSAIALYDWREIIDAYFKAVKLLDTLFPVMRDRHYGLHTSLVLLRCFDLPRFQPNCIDKKSIKKCSENEIDRIIFAVLSFYSVERNQSLCS
jgi:hypothetical protein